MAKSKKFLTEKVILDDADLIERIKNAKAGPSMTAAEMKAWLASRY